MRAGVSEDAGRRCGRWRGLHACVHADTGRRREWRRWSLHACIHEGAGRRDLGEEIVYIVLEDIETLFLAVAFAARQRRGAGWWRWWWG